MTGNDSKFSKTLHTKTLFINSNIFQITIINEGVKACFEKKFLQRLNSIMNRQLTEELLYVELLYVKYINFFFLMYSIDYRI